MPHETKNSIDLASLATPSAVPEWMTRMREAARACITESDIEAIVKGQVERAKTGDANAIKFVFDQVLGGASFRGATFVQTNHNYTTSPNEAAKPTTAKPGTEDRIEVMARRAQMGAPLRKPNDATFESAA